jgi:hypothetical protein
VEQREPGDCSALAGAFYGWDESLGSKRFFFEKKKQKTFIHLAARLRVIQPTHERRKL